MKTHSGEQIKLYDDYAALVIGVGDYEYWPKLPGAVDDAQDVAHSLRKMGFKIELVKNPTSSQLDDLLGKLPYNLGRKKERGLFIYFAGHGATETLADQSKLGYVIPKDCPLPEEDPAGFAAKGISLERFETLAKRVKSRHVLMAFDSCFSGSIFALGRDAPKHITRMIARPVRQFITAGNEEEEVPDVSVFKQAMLDGIRGDADKDRDGFVTGSELGYYLQSEVSTVTRGAQHPQYGKIRNTVLNKGDFVFQLAGGPGDQGGDPRQARIKQLLSEGDALLIAGSLTTPAGFNSLARYRSVLALDPLNQKALAGLKRIIEQYATWAEARIRAGDFSKAEQYLQRAEQVREGDAKMMALRDKLRKAKYKANIKMIGQTQKKSVYDKSSPTIELVNKQIFISVGGSAVAVYHVSTNVVKHGVLVGKRFYKGFTPWPNKPKTGVCYFALGHDQEKSTKILLWATSSTGKSASQNMVVRVRGKRFRNDRIMLSQRTIAALAAKLPGLPTNLDEIGKFIYINEHLRKQNNATIKTAALDTLPFQLWDKAFMRPKGKPMAGFGDRRKYYYGKKLIAQSVHIGVDLADVAQSDIRAVAHGQVVLADNVGIFGNCILLDHGLGLMSMYAHLSSLLVTKGSYVSKGQLIAKSGNTGLALGDHLQFSVLVGGNFVQPSEWWDPSWVESNVFLQLRKQI